MNQLGGIAAGNGLNNFPNAPNRPLGNLNIPAFDKQRQ